VLNINRQKLTPKRFRPFVWLGVSNNLKLETMKTPELKQQFEDYKILHNFLYSKPLKKWINETNFKNLFIEDYNELMLVSEKIESLYDDGIDITQYSDGILIQNWREQKEIVRLTMAEEGLNRKEFAYRGFVLFIEWYNEIKPL
jgi:hypothetical protein